jgi:hypothetical protein
MNMGHVRLHYPLRSGCIYNISTPATPALPTNAVTSGNMHLSTWHENDFFGLLDRTATLADCNDDENVGMYVRLLKHQAISSGNVCKSRNREKRLKVMHLHVFCMHISRAIRTSLSFQEHGWHRVGAVQWNHERGSGSCILF